MNKPCFSMKICTLAMPLLGLFQALVAHADTGAAMDQLLSLSLEELTRTKVRISTHTEQVLSRAPSVVSVITAEDIRATGATNLTEALQNVPGIYIKSNLLGFKPQVMIRGSTAASQTLLMVNGAPIKDLQWSSGIYYKGLPASTIERVEIIRGPGSALFGADAFAGVINVITKTAGKITQSEAGARAGSFDTQAGWMQSGGKWNGFDVGFTAELSHTDGHDPFIEKYGQSARYGYDNQDIRCSLGNGDWRLLADYMRHSDMEIGLTGGAVLDPLTRAEDSRYNIALLYGNEAFARDWSLSTELRYRHIDSTSGDGFYEQPPGYPGYPDGKRNLQRSAEKQLSFEASGLYTGFKTHAIRLGGGHNWQDLYSVEHWVNYGTGPDGNPLPAGGPLVNISNSPYAFAPEKTRQISHLFLQDIWTLAHDWELTAGARHDHYSDFGNTLNPRLALVWQGTDRLTTKLMYGQAFRAPSYLELYSLTAATTPNPNLKPERSRTWDMAFSYLASRDLTLGLNLYRSAQADLIATNSAAANQYQNTGSNTSHGVELEARWQATKTLRLTGNLSDRDDSAFNSVPRQTAYLRADWAFMPGWNWNAQANWIGKHLPYGSRSPIGAYTLFDTTIRYARRQGWEFAASVRNLFDVDAREYSSSTLSSNLPLPGRSFYAETRYKF